MADEILKTKEPEIDVNIQKIFDRIIHAFESHQNLFVSMSAVLKELSNRVLELENKIKNLELKND
jgi:ribosome-associated translation inhibitor RaiA